MRAWQAYLEPLTKQFEKAADPDKARGARAYLKDQFEFFGIAAPDRKALLRDHYAAYGLPEDQILSTLIQELWKLPEREYQYFGMDLINRLVKRTDPGWVSLFEYTLTRKSWWDTVDFMASWPVGTYFRLNPQLAQKQVNSWLDSGNMWLQRTCLLFQLKYKLGTDTELLYVTIEATRKSKDFFLRKAIGWALREYSKTNPDWVRNLVDQTELSNLSRKEALRLIR